MAGHLQRTVNRAGDLVARYGGEEFVCLLPDSSRTGAVELAETLRAGVAALALPHAASPAGDTVTISVGVAVDVNGLYEDRLQLVAAADRALYEAKRAGRDRMAEAGA